MVWSFPLLSYTTGTMSTTAHTPENLQSFTRSFSEEDAVLVTKPTGELHEKDIVGLAGEDMAEVTAEVKLTWIT